MEDLRWMYPDGIRNPTVDPSTIKLAIAMVCFCDIRLTQTKYHAEHYGKFVIGMTKEWGVKNRISPVSYYHNQSLATDAIAHAINQGKQLFNHISQKYYPEGHLDLWTHTQVMNGALQAMSRFYKPVSGYENRNGKEEFIYYYDEREWRYTPDINPHIVPNMLFGGPISQTRLSLYENEFKDQALKTKYEQELKQFFTLSFIEHDVKYIILPDEGYLLNFKEKFEGLGIKLNYDLLGPKIRFYNEIEEDQ